MTTNTPSPEHMEWARRRVAELVRRLLALLALGRRL